MPALVSLPNPGSQGQPKFLLGADAALVEKWINAEDRPGFGVYDIPNPLRPGATRHGKDSIAAIEVLFFDVDLKDIVETPDQAERALANLVLTPSEVVHSGHGYHVKYRLKEPIDADDDPELFERACALQAQLIEYFCADPAVRPWSLLRRPGTTNTKSTPPVPCRVISAGPTVDLTDIEELASLVAGTALFTRKQINGHAAAAERDGPTDVDARLAAMRHGDEVHGVNATHCAVIPALIWRGVHPADIVERVVDATMEMAARVGLNWSREEEIVTVRRRYLSSLRNLFLKDYDHTTGVIPSWLPGEFHDAWAKVLQASRRPDIGYNPQGFHVKGWATRDSTGAQKAGARAHTAEERLGEGETKADRERKSGSGPGAPRVFALRPFIPFDPAMLPPRQWLYGKHYQRATVGATIAPGGVGKSSTNLVEAIAMATCRNLLGEQPEERLRVWFHNGDDPFDEVQRRVAAICTHYAIDQEELADWLWITTAEDFPLRVAEGYSNLAINDALVRQINAVVGDTRIDVCILDPLVKLHGVEERDNGRMNRVIEVFASIATAHPFT